MERVVFGCWYVGLSAEDFTTRTTSVYNVRYGKVMKYGVCKGNEKGLEAVANFWWIFG